MINISFYSESGKITGFTATGHGTVSAKDMQGKLVCAAVSSAVYLTVNTVTEIIGATVDCADNGDTFNVKLLSAIDESQVTMKGFLLHVTELSKQYKNKLHINSEV